MHSACQNYHALIIEEKSGSALAAASDRRRPDSICDQLEQVDIP
jgi:hypothetical protein